MESKKKVTKYLVSLCAVLAFVLLLNSFTPVAEGKAKPTEILLTPPVFAQQTTSFPTDEAGISAYVNVGQSINLEQAKNALRGIEAEGDDYVIGIMELPGLPEQEFPHMYISSNGWILAYYSKFAPASRIMHWGKYGGGTINTDTLQDAISKICPTIGVNFTQVKANIGYYHFKYPEATKMTIAVDTTERIEGKRKDDTFSYSIPSSITLYEGSLSHFSRGSTTRLVDESHRLISKTDKDASYLDCFMLKDTYLMRDKSHVMILWLDWADWQGVAAVFIYR